MTEGNDSGEAHPQDRRESFDAVSLSGLDWKTAHGIVRVVL